MKGIAIICAFVMESSIRSEEHTSELQSLRHLVCRLLLEKKKAELKLLNNALNEVLYGVKIKKQNFDTRLGEAQAASERLLTHLTMVVEEPNARQRCKVG